MPPVFIGPFDSPVWCVLQSTSLIESTLIINVCVMSILAFSVSFSQVYVVPFWPQAKYFWLYWNLSLRLSWYYFGDFSPLRYANSNNITNRKNMVTRHRWSLNSLHFSALVMRDYFELTCSCLQNASWDCVCAILILWWLKRVVVMQNPK